MKNLHIIPTDKPSRLVLEIKNNNLFITTTYFKNDLMKHQNIYITNSEEIKAGDYFWKPDCNMIFKAEYTPHKGCQKVILTTDQDLIKDRVQSIDNKFLEWLIKNPSCESVDVVKEGYKKNGMIDEATSYRYKIIIPQEEPKHNCRYSKAMNQPYPRLCVDCGKEEPKQESLSWDELIKEAGSEEQLIKILKLPHIAPLVREAMRNNCKKK
jgi:hypothetical protein